jgi:hypothetical protein
MTSMCTTCRPEAQRLDESSPAEIIGAESKDPEDVSFARLLQGILTRIFFPRAA